MPIPPTDCYPRMLSFHRVLVVLLLATGLASVARADAPGAQDVVKESFDVRSGGTLFIDVDQGNLEVEATRGATVLVEVRRRSDAGERAVERLIEAHDLDIRKDGNDVRIRSRLDKDGPFWRKWSDEDRLKITVRVRIPEDYNIDFTTGHGNVWLADIVGEVRGKTGAGNIDAEMITGDVDVLSGAGNITLDGMAGTVEVKTGAGNLTIRDANGPIDAGTGAGNLIAEVTSQPEYRCTFASGAGNVTVYMQENLDFYVDAVAGMGSASTDFPLTVEGKWMSKSFEGEVNGGGPTIELRSGVGNVSLRKL